MKDNIIQATVSVAIGALSAYFNILLVPLAVLICVMIIDYGTGMAEAYINKTLNSRIGVKGILKKICYLVLVCVGGVVDYLICAGLASVGIDYSSYCFSYCFGLIVAVWLIINELISILENLSELGTPIPPFLVKIVHRLKDSVDSKTDYDTDKKE